MPLEVLIAVGIFQSYFLLTAWQPKLAGASCFALPISPALASVE